LLLVPLLLSRRSTWMQVKFRHEKVVSLGLHAGLCLSNLAGAYSVYSGAEDKFNGQRPYALRNWTTLDYLVQNNFE
jgi:hypothetical protein